jgi:hypothetical protein
MTTAALIEPVSVAKVRDECFAAATSRRHVVRFQRKRALFFVMRPSHIGTYDPVLFRDAQFNFVGNVDRIKNDDPRAFVGNIVNQARHRCGRP